MRANKLGEMTLTGATMYAFSFIDKMVGAVWGKRMDILHTTLSYAEESYRGSPYYACEVTAAVFDNGALVTVVARMNLYPGKSSNIYGWSPSDNLDLRVRSVPVLKNMRLVFDLDLARGQFNQYTSEVKRAVTALVTDNSLQDLARIRAELGIQL